MSLRDIILVQEHARADRLAVVALYNRSFLSVVHVVEPQREPGCMERCRAAGALCKAYIKPSYKAVPDFNRPAAEVSHQPAMARHGASAAPWRHR